MKKKKWLYPIDFLSFSMRLLKCFIFRFVSSIKCIFLMQSVDNEYYRIVNWKIGLKLWMCLLFVIVKKTVCLCIVLFCVCIELYCRLWCWGSLRFVSFYLNSIIDFCPLSQNNFARFFSLSSLNMLWTMFVIKKAGKLYL